MPNSNNNNHLDRINIDISRKEVISYTLYLVELIEYIGNQLENEFHGELRIIKDHLYIKQNISPNIKLAFKLIDGKLDKAIALHIPNKGTLKNNIFLVTSFGSIKIATILKADFNIEKIKTSLQELDLNQDGDFLFATKDHLGAAIAFPATLEDINNSYTLNNQLMTIFPQIISEAKHLESSFPSILRLDITASEAQQINLSSKKEIIGLNHFIADQIIPQAIELITSYIAFSIFHWTQNKISNIAKYTEQPKSESYPTETQQNWQLVTHNQNTPEYSAEDQPTALVVFISNTPSYRMEETADVTTALAWRAIKYYPQQEKEQILELYKKIAIFLELQEALETYRTRTIIRLDEEKLQTQLRLLNQLQNAKGNNELTENILFQEFETLFNESLNQPTKASNDWKIYTKKLGLIAESVRAQDVGNHLCHTAKEILTANDVKTAWEMMLKAASKQNVIVSGIFTHLTRRIKAEEDSEQPHETPLSELIYNNIPLYQEIAAASVKSSTKAYADYIIATTIKSILTMAAFPLFGASASDAISSDISIYILVSKETEKLIDFLSYEAEKMEALGDNSTIADEIL